MISIKKALLLFTSLILLSSCCDLFQFDFCDTDDYIPSLITDKTLWGHWIRMDTQEHWYIASDRLEKNDNEISIKASSTGSISTTDLEIEKQSENVLKVNGTYFLFRKSGVQGTVTGRIAEESTNRSLVNIGGIQVLIQNKNNPANKIETTSDSDGTFSFTEIIPGDPYEIKVDFPEAPVISVTPQSVSEDIGTINLSDESYNFKIEAQLPESYIYYPEQNYSIEVLVKNIGTEASLGTSWLNNLPQAPGVNITSTTPAILGTIEPNDSKTINLTLNVDHFNEELRDIIINLHIKDVNNGIWEDNFSVRVYQRPMSVNVSSINMPVYGILLTPERQGIWFQTGGTGEYKTTSLQVPYRESGYIISFSRATVDTETAYSFGFDAPTASSDDFLAYFNDSDFPSSYESNNNEHEIASFPYGNTISSYLHSTDVDFYSPTFDDIPEYQITYNSNGASSGIVPDSQIKVHGIRTILADNSGNLIKNGFPFLHWNTEANGQGTTYQENEVYTNNESIMLYAQFGYNIGDTGPAGGTIFYKHIGVDPWYLEAWIYDEPESYQWQTGLYSTLGTHTNLGTGYHNTYDVLEGTEHPAASVARNASHGGYYDWFLPSKDELNEMYGIVENLSLLYYLSSSEYYDDYSDYNNSYAWGQNLTNGSQCVVNKDNLHGVRVARFVF